MPWRDEVAEMDSRTIANGELELCVQLIGRHQKSKIRQKMQIVRTDPFPKQGESGWRSATGHTVYYENKPRVYGDDGIQGADYKLNIQ